MGPGIFGMAQRPVGICITATPATIPPVNTAFDKHRNKRTDININNDEKCTQNMYIDEQTKIVKISYN